MSLGYGASIVRNGLVLHLDATNQKSYPGTGTTWYDLSGNNNNASLVNGPTHSENTFVFDGVDDYLITSSVTFKSIMMSLNYYNTGPNSSWKYLIDARSGASGGYYVPSNNAFGGSWKSTNRINTNSGSISDIPFNQWHTLYLEATDTFTDDINFMSRVSNNEVAGGAIGVIMIYDRYLTEDEVSKNHIAIRSRYNI